MGTLGTVTMPGSGELHIHVLVYLGLLFLASQLGGRLAQAINVPRVAGYLVSGILLGPSVLGVFPRGLVESDFAIVTEMALAVIAFSIGGSLSITKLKRVGKSIFLITACEGVVACLLVTLLLSLILPWTAAADGTSWRGPLAMALVAGSVSAATAPAAILGIVHEYRSRGPLTTVLMGVVALDDGLAIVLFAFGVNLAQSLLVENGMAWLEVGRAAGVGVLLALVVGGAVGASLWKAMVFFRSADVRLGVLLGTILFTSGAALSLGASPLLACMTLGFVVVNFVEHQQDAFSVVEHVEEPLFGLFFALAGAHLDFSLLVTSGWLALILLIARFAGKLVGASFAATMTGADDSVRRYLGVALMPQAGVTIGLALAAEAVLPAGELLNIVVNAVLASVVLNELITPFAVRFALGRAGETRKPAAAPKKKAA